MRRGTDLGQRVRRLGLVASFRALMAIGVTVLADNRNIGFGQSVTRRQQRFLLGLATLLCAAQTITFLINRRRDKLDWRRYSDRLSSGCAWREKAIGV